MPKTKSITSIVPAYLMDVMITLKMGPKSFGELDAIIHSPAVLSRRIKFLLRHKFIEAKPIPDAIGKCYTRGDRGPLWRYHITKKGINLAEDMEPIYYRLKTLAKLLE